MCREVHQSNIAGVCDDEKTGEGKKVTMALTEAFTYYEDEDDEEDEVERARIACEPTQVCDSGGETDEGEGGVFVRRGELGISKGMPKERWSHYAYFHFFQSTPDERGARHRITGLLSVSVSIYYT